MLGRYPTGNSRATSFAVTMPADAEEPRWIGIIAGRHRQHVHHLEGTVGMFPRSLQLLPPALDRVLGSGQGAQDGWHVGEVT
jgi:hypothetical protein